MRVTDTHVFFWGSYLSNFMPCRIVPTEEMAVKGISYNCSEQVFMVEKAAFFNDYDIVKKMMNTDDPGNVKFLGRQVKRFDEKAWYDVSYDKMLIACRAKFFQNIPFAKELVNTGNRVIVEASPYDKIWGIGLHEDDDAVLDEKNWDGENRLGKVLMQVREELR